MYADDTTIYFKLDDFNERGVNAEVNNKLEKVNLCLKLKIYLSIIKRLR